MKVLVYNRLIISYENYAKSYTKFKACILRNSIIDGHCNNIHL